MKQSEPIHKATTGSLPRTHSFLGIFLPRPFPPQTKQNKQKKKKTNRIQQPKKNEQKQTKLRIDDCIRMCYDTTKFNLEQIVQRIRISVLMN